MSTRFLRMTRNPMFGSSLLRYCPEIRSRGCISSLGLDNAKSNRCGGKPSALTDFRRRVGFVMCNRLLEEAVDVETAATTALEATANQPLKDNQRRNTGQQLMKTIKTDWIEESVMPGQSIRIYRIRRTARHWMRVCKQLGDGILLFSAPDGLSDQLICKELNDAIREHWCSLAKRENETALEMANRLWDAIGGPHAMEVGDVELLALDKLTAILGRPVDRQAG